MDKLSFGNTIFSIRHSEVKTYSQQDLAHSINHIFLALRQNYSSSLSELDDEDKNSNWPTNATVSYWEKKDLAPQLSYLKELAILGVCIRFKAVTDNQELQRLVRAWGFRPLHRPEITLLATAVEFKPEIFYSEMAESLPVSEPVTNTRAIPSKPKKEIFLKQIGLVSTICLLLIIGLLVGHSRTLFSKNGQHQIVSKVFNDVEMVLVPAGCFQMGHPDGRSDRFINVVHTQCVDHDFWIDRFEVTNAVYGSPSSTEGDCDYEREIPSGKVLEQRVGGDEPERPRNCVDWFEANTHCQTRSARLPTEREWEYAARGPDGWIYPWGNIFEKERANIRIQGIVYFAAAKDAYPNGASWVGAYNMSGGLYEWVSSGFGPYPYVSNDGREDLSDQTIDRIIRGGSWDWPVEANDNLVQSSYYRSFAIPTTKSNGFGFRCVLETN